MKGIYNELKVKKRFGILGRLKGSIPFLVATIKSPSEMNKVGREVKGSSFYIVSIY